MTGIYILSIISLIMCYALCILLVNTVTHDLCIKSIKKHGVYTVWYRLSLVFAPISFIVILICFLYIGIVFLGKFLFTGKT